MNEGTARFTLEQIKKAHRAAWDQTGMGLECAQPAADAFGSAFEDALTRLGSEVRIAHPVTDAMEGQWHKIVALLMYRDGVTATTIAPDIVTAAAADPKGMNVAIRLDDERGIVLLLLNDKTAEEVAEAEGCGCERSDAWRCAVGRRLSSIACHCRCHRYIEDRLTWEEAKRRARHRA